eukprot:CAMPEP_0172685946 /NCGR_PEP_ID=MMETSP1074-20121228/20596_1 /TAXON_ID=2916 /ORGANISM="Ceratium fusus, Strain PA161109" /LENGTH=66 /DNA_ID=CAMNT_0013505183 /DNA_START=722 /DNA_END=922 /DNA_ORIENTATION=-
MPGDHLPGDHLPDDPADAWLTCAVSLGSDSAHSPVPQAPAGLLNSLATSSAASFGQVAEHANCHQL